MATTVPDLDDLLVEPGFAADPHPTYHRLRDAAPILWSEHQGHWVVTSFDLVQEVLTQHETFSSVGFETRHIDRLPEPTRLAAVAVTAHFETLQMVSSDPPDHTRLRRAFGPGFLPRNVAGLAPMIRAIADRLLEGVDAFDLMTDFAEPLPVEVVSEVVGIPGPDRARIPGLTLAQREFFGSANPSPKVAERYGEYLGSWRSSMRQWLDDRRANPADDILTRTAAMIDDGRISEAEAIATLLHLVVAGNGTTTALIGNLVYLLLSNPDQLTAVTHDRSLVPNAVEEALRFEAPLPRDRRIALHDVEIGGVTIRSGDLVMSVLAAANRDPAHFPDPDRFDVTRSFDGSHHVAFGRGIHLCLGAPVARLEASIALEAVLDHLPDPTFDGAFDPSWHAVATHRGLGSLPIRSGRP